MNPFLNTLLELIVALALGFGIGVATTSAYKNNEQKVALNEQQARFDAAVHAAQEAKELAEIYSLEVEHATQKKIAAIETQHQTDLGIANEKRDKAISDLRAGTNRLRIATDPNSAACSSAVPGAASNTRISVAQTTTNIPGFVAERLISRASQADEIVVQLQACQDILVNERQPYSNLTP